MREGWGIDDGWVVSSKIKDQHGLMKDRLERNEDEAAEGSDTIQIRFDSSR